MLAYYGASLGPNQTETPEGYLICRNAPIARTGEQEYLAQELQLEGDPMRPVRVWREEEQVFSPAAIASFEGKPVTDGHPPESVSPANFAAYAKGHIQNVRRQGNLLVGDLHIHDPALAGEIRSGAKRQISCGYDCVYQPSGDGFKQTNIRGNHVAVVLRGRAGPAVAIQDEQPEKPKEKGRETMEENKTPQTAPPADEKPACDTPVQADSPAPAQPAEDLAGKLDKVLELLTALGKKPEPSSADQVLDDLLEKLAGKEEENGPAQTIEALADALTGGARDAALSILRAMRPVVASMKDEALKRQVTDALLSSIEDAGKLPALAQTARQRAQKAATDAKPQSFEDLCQQAQAAYAARNPHKKKQED